MYCLVNFWNVKSKMPPPVKFCPQQMPLLTPPLSLTKTATEIVVMLNTKQNHDFQARESDLVVLVSISMALFPQPLYKQHQTVLLEPRLSFHKPLATYGQVTIIFVVSVCLFVQFFSAVFDPISIKLGHMLYVWV